MLPLLCEDELIGNNRNIPLGWRNFSFGKDKL